MRWECFCSGCFFVIISGCLFTRRRLTAVKRILRPCAQQFVAFFELCKIARRGVSFLWPGVCLRELTRDGEVVVSSVLYRWLRDRQERRAADVTKDCAAIAAGTVSRAGFVRGRVELRRFRFFHRHCRYFVLALRGVAMCAKRVLNRVGDVAQIVFCFDGRHVRAVGRGVKVRLALWDHVAYDIILYLRFYNLLLRFRIVLGKAVYRWWTRGSGLCRPCRSRSAPTSVKRDG